jgi:endonuclease/exonuclease/phosphatase family metal-dependent hydrolase
MEEHPMKNKFQYILSLGIVFLFLIQLSGILVESIYILDLMHTSLDAKVLGVLFFFTPLLLLPFRKRLPGWTFWLFFSLLFLARGLVPYLNTDGRMLASGIGVGAALLILPALLTSRSQKSFAAAASLALAVVLSILLRTLDYSLDLSLTPGGSWIGWGLGLFLGWALTGLTWDETPTESRSNAKLVAAVLGIFMVFTLAYFAFSAPAVIARWTQGNYTLIVSTVSLLTAAWTFLAITRPALLDRLPQRFLLIGNIFFTISLTATILAHRVQFPQTPGSPAVVLGDPSWWQQIPLALMLLSFPVIFWDVRLFFATIQKETPSEHALLPGLLVGSLALVLLVFINIFTNVWGYVAPVSTIFRNQFHLPYFLITALLCLLVWRQRSPFEQPAQGAEGGAALAWGLALGGIFLITALMTVGTEQVGHWDSSKTSLLVMTYNIQEANDASAQKSYDRQLALIQKVAPDIISLQETDSTRISLGNNDYVRYYAAKLGYYSYFGPATVTGTFGTSLLSKYPLENTRVSFTFSDSDEVGTAEAEVNVGGRIFTIYDVHPDGSDDAKLAFARSVLTRSQGKQNVIILGDFNLRDTEQAFNLIASVYTNAWTSVYPSKIGADGTDMSGRNRIDHIFISPSLLVRNPVYILPPESATDHPVHWAEIYWGK